jgi:hypothetical protein
VEKLGEGVCGLERTLAYLSKNTAGVGEDVKVKSPGIRCRVGYDDTD